MFRLSSVVVRDLQSPRHVCRLLPSRICTSSKQDRSKQTYHPKLTKHAHLTRLLEMAQNKADEPIDVKIGRPRVRGIDLTRDPLLNKGMSFTLQERQLLGLHGLLPPAITSPDQQVYVVMQNFYRWDNDLDRYIYMMSLQDRNEKLFYRTITQNVELMMPIIYTPTVGQACLKYGLTLRKPRNNTKINLKEELLYINK